MSFTPEAMTPVLYPPPPVERERASMALSASQVRDLGLGFLLDANDEQQPPIDWCSSDMYVCEIIPNPELPGGWLLHVKAQEREKEYAALDVDAFCRALGGGIGDCGGMIVAEWRPVGNPPKGLKDQMVGIGQDGVTTRPIDDVFVIESCRTSPQDACVAPDESVLFPNHRAQQVDFFRFISALEESSHWEPKAGFSWEMVAKGIVVVEVVGAFLILFEGVGFVIRKFGKRSK